ncbi:MAG: TolC family protein, partial [Chitinophagaceae bacterium]|nr:TolC family protein [Chitinophagaceae bacterium]
MQTPLRFIVFSSLIVMGFSDVRAQDGGKDSIRLTITQTDNLFLKNNFQLLLKQYDIQNAEAAIITARLFDNPQLSIENVLYNPGTRKVFDMSHNGGQYQMQVAQLFRLAGKRNKNIKLAEAGAKLPEYEFAGLLRTLRNALHN